MLSKSSVTSNSKSGSQSTPNGPQQPNSSTTTHLVNNEFIYKSDNDISGDNLINCDENETTSNGDRLSDNKLQGLKSHYI